MIIPPSWFCGTTHIYLPYIHKEVNLDNLFGLVRLITSLEKGSTMAKSKKRQNCEILGIPPVFIFAGWLAG